MSNTLSALRSNFPDTVAIRDPGRVRPARDLGLLGLLVLGWLALVSWSGVGPDSWQAGICAGLTDQPAGCAAVRFGKDEFGKDESRIVPHAAAAGRIPS